MDKHLTRQTIVENAGRVASENAAWEQMVWGSGRQGGRRWSKEVGKDHIQPGFVCLAKRPRFHPGREGVPEKAHVAALPASQGESTKWDNVLPELRASCKELDRWGTRVQGNDNALWLGNTLLSYTFSLSTGDEILELNGESMAGLTHQDALQKFKVTVSYQHVTKLWGLQAKKPSSRCPNLQIQTVGPFTRGTSLMWVLAQG